MSKLDENAKGLPAGVLKRLKAKVAKAGDYATVSARSGVPLGTLHKLMRGVTDPRFSTITELCRSLGISLDYLVSGIGDESGDWESWLPEIGKSEKRIPFRDIGASAGHGAEIFEEDPKYWITFSLEWLKSLGDPSAMEILRVDGDSMEPELRDGDQVMIDLQQRHAKDGMFVVLVDGRLFLKRVRVLGRSSIELVSSNSNYPPFKVEIPGDDDTLSQDGASIIGRVVWSGRTA